MERLEAWLRGKLYLIASQSEEAMTGNAVAEEEIVAAVKLSASGDFATALVKHEENLGRALDDGTRTRILYAILSSVLLDSYRDDVTNQALEALRQLPDATRLRICGLVPSRASSKSAGNAKHLI